MCIDMKLNSQLKSEKNIAKYELGNFCEQYGLPSLPPSRRRKSSNKFIHHYRSSRHKPYFQRKENFEPDKFYSKNKPKKNWNKNRKPYSKKRSFDKSKTKCFKCHKTGHFANECQVKTTINQLTLTPVEKENLIKVLELRNTDSENDMSEDIRSLSGSSSSESEE